MTFSTCSHCMQHISWDTTLGIWDELKGTPAWMLGRCPHCGKVLLLLLNTQFYGDICGTHMIHMEQGPDFQKMVPWDRVMQSKFFLNVLREQSPNYAMGSAFSRLPKKWSDMCTKIGAPRVIADRAQYDAVFKIVTMMAGHEMTDDQSDYLETLQMMVERWEDKNCEIGSECGHDKEYSTEGCTCCWHCKKCNSTGCDNQA